MTAARTLKELIKGVFDAAKEQADFMKSKTEHSLMEKRIHFRLRPQVDNVMTITLANGVVAPIVNVSYGGFACEKTAKLPDLARNTEIAVEIRIFDRRLPFRAIHLRSVNDICAFTIPHDRPDTLLFLRDSIEPMRHGVSMTKVAPENIKEYYRKGEWVYFHGEGPSDIMMRRENGALAEAIMTFYRDKSYREIRFENGKLSTGVALDKSGMAASRMATSTEHDRDSLHHGACLLLTLPAEECHDLRLQLLKQICR